MPSSTTSSDRVRVLLVDDNEAMLSRARAILAAECEVVGAVKDGPTALDAADDLHPDVVVLDISMPGMSGFDVACHLRDAGSPPAIVFLTVHDGEEFVVAAQKAGGLGFVVKSRLTFDLLLAVQKARMGASFISRLQ
jgi:DNA-binding NarL/FixJ family response regulator